MGLYVISRRSITFRQATTGEATVLLVPGGDQVQVVKDLAGVNDGSQQAQTSVMRGPQLSRVFSGQRYIYGYLPEEIRELRQSVKVWLAEDMVPADCQGFFYVFSPQVIIHGVREQSDEGQKSWRTAQLVLPSDNTLKDLANAITDYVLANPGASLCVAVLNQLELYNKLKEVLQPYHITPVPFSTLKPQIGLKPLYKHLDHTIFYMIFLLVGIILFAASSMFWYLNFAARSKLDAQIEQIQTQIRNIQLNQSTGHIQNPQPVLNSMSKVFNQRPSAIIDAAANVAYSFGDISQIDFAPIETTPGNPSVPEHQVVKINVGKSRDKLLLTQENRALMMISKRPWVRDIRRTGVPGEQSLLAIEIQSEGADQTKGDVLSYAQREVTPTVMEDPSVTQAVAADPSATISVSGTISVSPALPLTSPTAGVRS